MKNKKCPYCCTKTPDLIQTHDDDCFFPNLLDDLGELAIHTFRKEINRPNSSWNTRAEMNDKKEDLYLLIRNLSVDSTRGFIKWENDKCKYHKGISEGIEMAINEIEKLIKDIE